MAIERQTPAAERLKGVTRAKRPAGRRLPSRDKRRLGATVATKEHADAPKSAAYVFFSFSKIVN